MQGVAWLMEHNPKIRVGYFTYGDQLSTSKARFALQTARNAGVKLDREAAGEWTTLAGGYMLAGGVGGTFTGFGVNCLALDDVYKNRREAESPLVRQGRLEWFRDVARTRLEPGGSILALGTRWHEDDLQGELVKMGYEYIRLQALDDAGRSLWPERWSVAELHNIQKEVGEYTWQSLYQGTPRGRGAKVFQDAWFYDTLPSQQYRAAIGLDLAYSAKSTADSSVALLMLKGKDGLVYIEDARKAQIEAPLFKDKVRSLKSRRSGATVRWYFAGPEKGVADFFKAKPDPCPINALPASSDKFIRAIPVAAAWNRGEILLPENAAWVPDFRVGNGFTGVGDAEDDECLAAGTLVDCESGPVKIEDVRSGDLVHTRLGLRRVAWAGMTSPASVVFDVTLCDGRVLTATGSHPVWVDGMGFMPVDSLTADSYLMAWPTPSHSTESNSGATQSPGMKRTEGITALASGILSLALTRFTGKSGSTTTAPSRQECTSTTGTETSSTTASQTLNASLHPSTAPFTLTTGDQASSSATSQASGPLQPPGIPLPLASNGTRITPGQDGSHGLQQEQSASRADPHSRRFFQSALATVLTLAARSLGHRPGPIAGSVSSAALSSGRTKPSSELARVRVATVCARPEAATVFNLKVEEEPEFFANGVLVHNCDALAAGYDELNDPRGVVAKLVTGDNSSYRRI